ncbi:MAG: HlyD family efflux transporter periplasmic adaptor subunit [Phycisphaerales bacterium]|jgi:HlyD family secretion protein|nr:HlyD family efflux transporter periplasmic adaptor subunit [Phycisphaerales bacterium]
MQTLRSPSVLRLRGLSTPATLFGCLVVVVLIFFLVPRGSSTTSSSLGAGALYEVTRGDFDITVPASGELAALQQVNIHNKLESGAVIIELVEEGTKVKSGDVVLRLNDESIKNAIRNAQDALTTGENNVKSASTGLEILKKKRDSELAVKQLSVDLATLSLQSWREGEVVAKRQALDLALQTAEKDYKRLLGKYESSIKLYEKEFLSKDELDTDEIVLLNAEAQLKKVKLDAEVYNNYTYKQEKQKKESDLQQAIDELDRAKERLASEIKSSESNVQAAQSKLDNKREALEKLEGQLAMCVVTSPASGMVVYASSLREGRNREDEPLKVGKQLYRNELVLIIPNVEQMVAEVKVNEALSGLIEAGQSSVITCDAFPDAVFNGTVESVGVLASGGGWRDPNRRDYTIRILFDEENTVGLKPSMRCAADILVGTVQNELYLPIHAVHRSGGTVWVWVQEDGGFGQREIEVGKFSEAYTVVLNGVDEGEVVLLREPPPSMVVRTLKTEE